MCQRFVVSMSTWRKLNLTKHFKWKFKSLWFFRHLRDFASESFHDLLFQNWIFLCFSFSNANQTVCSKERQMDEQTVITMYIFALYLFIFFPICKLWEIEKQNKKEKNWLSFSQPFNVITTQARPRHRSPKNTLFCLFYRKSHLFAIICKYCLVFTILFFSIRFIQS